MEVCHFAENCNNFLSLIPFGLENIDPRSPKLLTLKFTGVSFHLPSLVTPALIEYEIAGRGRICPPPFPGRVILRPFPVRVLTRAPLALQIFSRLLGGGGGEDSNTPSISAPIGRRKKSGNKSFEILSKMITKLFQSIFRSGQNCGLQGPEMPKISSFSLLSNIVSENLHYLDNYYS